ncbi:hypothetical protein M011DRAFT_485630 [Sporormia fimetaria CBS 119925]|uniref:Cora-domain-containing protein n=1 Tax=Sporormia fimetaria CBS 119925 TaxID=1340428 RepID=A0A6A6VGV7_9PLEO|nr:hypothetical protein M011DRAFT_485630 [Sporormia fimetaria CBS 119925]
MSIEELRNQLDTLQRSHDELLRHISTPSGSKRSDLDARPLRRIKTRDERAGRNGFDSSSSESDDSEGGEEAEHFVDQPLPSHSFDHEDLRAHLKTYDWTQPGLEILSGLFTAPGRLRTPSLFPVHPGPAEDRSHYSHFQVYDVCSNGTVEAVEPPVQANPMSRATEIWHMIREVGSPTSQDRKPVGRITIAREPAPVLFAALHLTLSNAFDMDELFSHLISTDPCSAHMQRAFSPSELRQRTFFFSFEYYTIIGEDCKPMSWQLSTRPQAIQSGHIPITRCGSIVALSLYDSSPRRLRTRGRRGQAREGWVRDVWSPWQVAVIECFPDWKATTDTFESGHRYLNGPDAFLTALLTEFRDARKRFDEIYRRISKLVIPPAGFLFEGRLRDERLFEDGVYRWTRRYFFAHQTLGSVNDCIKSMIDAFEDTFTEDVWQGRSTAFWPLFEEELERNQHWRQRLRYLRTHFNREMKELRTLIKENNERRAEIRTLQDHLFSGTSIQESRKSVELTDITVQQGRNIKLLTLVNMIFVPLTFVTSVFGMTNMDTEPQFWQFGITLATVCVPFFLLIGFLNTDSGYRMFIEKTKALWLWLRPKKHVDVASESKQGKAEFLPTPMNRTLTTEDGMRRRLGQAGVQGRERSGSETHPNIRRIIKAAGEKTGSGNIGKQSDEVYTGDGHIGESARLRNVVIDIEPGTKENGEQYRLVAQT